MASLTGEQLKDTYESLLKLSDNDALTATYKEVTDGEGAGTNLYVGTGGNVGIGGSPSQLLHLKKSGTPVFQITDTQASGKYFLTGVDTNNTFLRTDASILFQVGGTTERMKINGSSGDISFRDTSNNQAFYWDASTARLGLGTDSPANTLTIKGGAHQLDIETDSSGVSLESIDRTALSDPSDISYYARNGSHKFFNGSYTERMRIDSSGNVGIGATSVTSNFRTEIAGGDFRVGDTQGEDAVEIGWSAGGSQGFVQAYDRGDSAFRNLMLNGSLLIESGGNVGIGANSPNAVGSRKTLEIEDLSGTAIRLSESGVDNAFLSYDSTSFFRLSSSDNMTFLTSGSEAMRIDSDGNVGIGTTPNAFSNQTSLTVRGTSVSRIDLQGAGGSGGGVFLATATETQLGGNFNIPLKIFTSSTAGITFETNSNPRMTIDSSGNVGIGTDLPTSYTNGTTLEIKGKTSTGAGLLKVTNANGTTSGAFYAGSSSLVLSAQTTHNLSLGTDNQTRMTIDTSGHVTVQDGGFLIIDTGAVGANPRLYFRQDDINATNFIEVDRGTNAMEFWNNGSERMRILSGGGITFNGDTATANALDDYEEGTFTPIIFGSTTAGTATFSHTSGNYTKIGDLVHFNLNLVVTDWTGSPAGEVRVGDLPFVAESGQNSRGYVPVSTTVTGYSGYTFTANAYIQPSTDYIRFFDLPDASADTAFEIRLAGTYKTDS